MKRFSFSLEKARRYREAQLQMEEARLAMLLASEASIRHRIEELRNGHWQQRQALTTRADVTSAELARLHEFGEFVWMESKRLEREAEALRKEVDAQTARVAERKQGVELLQKLKDKEWNRWKVEEGKELQTAAEESFHARWIRESNAASPGDNNNDTS